MKQIVRCLSSCLVVAAFTSVPAAASDQSFPSQPIRLVVPYAPGGSADILARVLGESMQSRLGETVIVENRPGGGTIIGARSVAAAPADGHTLLVGTVSSHAMTPAVNTTADYDPVRDFSAVGRIASMPFAMLTRSGFAAEDLSQLIAMAREEPGRFTYGSAGVGTSNHMAGELLNAQADIDLTHIPYRGSAPAMNALLAGEVDVMFDLVATATPHIESGKVKALGTTGGERSSFLPDLPTLASQELPEYEVTAWFGLFGPAGMPEPVVAELNAVLNDILNDADTQQRFQKLGITPETASPEQFAEFVAAEAGKWGQTVKTANIVMNR